MEDEDVPPPLEDLTELIASKARVQEKQPQDVPRMRSDARKAAVASKETGVAKEKSSSSFGGFSKGFLLSTSSKEKKPRKKDKQTPRDSQNVTLKKDAEKDDDIPFLRPQAAKTAGPVFPEVQEAMKEAYPLLDTQGWMTDELFEKIEKHPLLSRALQDPNLARALCQFQSDPKTALQAAASNPEMQTFLKEFCTLMGSHFTELADKQESEKEDPVDDEVQRILKNKEVKEALSDPQIMQLFTYLKEDTTKAQRLLSTAGSDLRQKVQLLIDNGLLALQ